MWPGTCALSSRTAWNTILRRSSSRGTCKSVRVPWLGASDIACFFCSPRARARILCMQRPSRLGGSLLAAHSTDGDRALDSMCRVRSRVVVTYLFLLSLSWLSMYTGRGPRKNLILNFSKFNHNVHLPECLRICNEFRVLVSTLVSQEYLMSGQCRVYRYRRYIFGSAPGDVYW